MFEYLKISKQT